MPGSHARRVPWKERLDTKQDKYGVLPMKYKKVDEIYRKHISPPSTEEQLHLLVQMAQHIVAKSKQKDDPEKRSILELHGLGKEIWNDIDAQEFVNTLRDEWDHR